jgi:hypothetical protein
MEAISENLNVHTRTMQQVASFALAHGKPWDTGLQATFFDQQDVANRLLYLG